jgi:hypothetical protein
MSSPHGFLSTKVFGALPNLLLRKITIHPQKISIETYSFPKIFQFSIFSDNSSPAHTNTKDTRRIRAKNVYPLRRFSRQT